MHNLVNYNHKKYNVSRFYNMDLGMDIVFAAGMAKDEDDIKELDLIIGNRRKHCITVPYGKCGDVYLLTYNQDRHLSYEKIDITLDKKTQHKVIDLEKYLISRNISYEQLESKLYSKERNKKKEDFDSTEINKCGEFLAAHWWMDIDVYRANALLFPGSCLIGDNEVVGLGYEYFDDSMVNSLRSFTKKKNVLTNDRFRELFHDLAGCSMSLVRTQYGVIRFDGSFDKFLTINLNFPDGEYELEEELPALDSDNFEERVSTLSNVVYSIAKAKTLKECEAVISKARIIGLL